jgi:ribosomal protein L37AE/L43A
MTERVIWKCDGCDIEIVRSDRSTTDWKLYTVTMDNSNGYPVCRSEPVVSVSSHLCPSCAKELADRINPRHWPRTVAAPPQVAA